MRKAIRSTNIENLTGSNFDDTLEGNAGNNKLVGGLGIDTVSYAHAASGANGQGVTVNLAADHGAEHDHGRHRHAERLREPHRLAVQRYPDAVPPATT